MGIVHGFLKLVLQFPAVYFLSVVHRITAGIMKRAAYEALFKIMYFKPNTMI